MLVVGLIRVRGAAPAEGLQMLAHAPAITAPQPRQEDVTLVMSYFSCPPELTGTSKHDASPSFLCLHSPIHR